MRIMIKRMIICFAAFWMAGAELSGGEPDSFVVDVNDPALWSTAEGAVVSEIASPWEPGKKNIQFFYPGYVEGSMNRWAAAVIGIGDLLPQNPEQYSLLSFLVRNTSENAAEFRVHFRGINDERWATDPIPVQAGEDRLVEVDLTRVFAGIPPQNLAQIHLYSDMYPGTFSLAVRSFHFERGLERKFSRVADRVKAVPGSEIIPAFSSRWFELKRQLGQWETKSFDSITARQEELDRIAGEIDEMIKMFSIYPAVASASGHVRTNHRNLPVGIGVVDSATKISYENIPYRGTWGGSIRWQAARREHVASQVVLVPAGEEAMEVFWDEGTTLQDGRGHELPVEVRVVGYVKTVEPSAYTPPYVGWWPDVLLEELNSLLLLPCKQYALWISCAVPESAVPGMYAGMFAIRDAAGNREEVPIELEVFHYALPGQAKLKTAVGYFENWNRDFYGAAWNRELSRKFRDFFLAHRTNVDCIYGGALGDWSGKSPSVEEFADLKKKGQNYITVKEWFKDNIIAAGMEDIAYFYGWDEFPAEQIDTISREAAALKAFWPEVKILTTAEWKYWKDARLQAIDAWCPTTRVFFENLEQVAEMKQAGKEVWYYVCFQPGEPYANLMIEQPGIYPRILLGAISWKYQVDGFLYYRMIGTGSNRKTVSGAPLCDWNSASYLDFNGDGHLVYPGPRGPLSSIRYENWFFGLQDYDSLWLLRKWEERFREDARYAELVPEVRDALRIPPELVESMEKFSADGEVLSEWKRRLQSVLDRCYNVLDDDGRKWFDSL